MPPSDRSTRLQPEPGDYDADFWARVQELPGDDGPVSDATPEPTRTARPGGSANGLPASPVPPSDASPGPQRSRRRRRRRGVRVLLGFVVLLALLAVGTAFWTWRTWSGVERVDVTPVLAPASSSGVNYLLVGSDSREGITGDDPNAAALIGEEVLGQRSDTVMILRVTDTDARFLSLPRDLWLPIAGTGREQRLNTAYAQGPETLIRTVDESLGIPVHHYVEIDLATFADVVDAMGGVVIDFPYPAYDRASGLDIPTAGPVLLDGPQALAYVRSRGYTEIVDGAPRVDPTGDLGRGQRQQNFLRTVLDQAAATRNPATAARLFGAVSGGVTVDDTLDLGAVIDLAMSLRDSPPASTELPVYNWTTSGGAAVLGLADGADAVLAGFR